MGQRLDENNSGNTRTAPVFAESLRGQFLVAMPSLRESVFSHSITYVCDHNSEGAMGLVINHPMQLDLGDIFRQLELPEDNPASDQTVLAGGPVQADRGFVLHPANSRWESTIAVSPEVSLTASRDVIAAMAEGRGPDKALVALGYASWSGGQLDTEIAANSWLTLPGDPQILFDTPCEQRWAATSRQLGVDLNLIHGTAGHA